MSEKIQVGIYKINLDHEVFLNAESALDRLEARIISDDASYTSQELVESLGEDHVCSLLYATHQTNPKWKTFFKDLTAAGQSIFQPNMGKVESFIMLVEKISEPAMYVVVGGNGYFAIQDYIEDDFGVEVLSRIITKDEKILRSVREKSVLGGVLGTTKFFRNSYNLFENDSFGKIYQELQAQINKDILSEHFGFSVDELKKGSVCVAKASFKINKSITLTQLVNIINGCDYVLRNLDPIMINSVKKINSKQESPLVGNLTNELHKQLWQRYDNQDYFIDFDLCHADFEKYLTASEYIVKKNFSQKDYFGKPFIELVDIDSIFQRIRISNSPPADKGELVDLVESLKIYSYAEEGGNELTKGWLIDHLFGDVEYRGKRYFYIDKNWFLIEATFLNELELSCRSFIKDHYDTGRLEKEWDDANEENDYNAGYFDTQNTLVLDWITPDGIEACDVLRWDDECIYLCHVKDGFGNSMRALASQIFLAANRIMNDENSNYEYISKLYDQIVSKSGSENEYLRRVAAQSASLSKDDFIELFKSRRKVFVLAVVDSEGRNRSLQTQLGRFKSSIAKFSLQELVRDMRGIDVQLNICQIKRNIEANN